MRPVDQLPFAVTFHGDSLTLLVNKPCGGAIALWRRLTPGTRPGSDQLRPWASLQVKTPAGAMEATGINARGREPWRVLRGRGPAPCSRRARHRGPPTPGRRIRAQRSIP